MNSNNSKIEAIANSPYKEHLLDYLKEVQDHIADVRNGDYSAEARVAAVEAIDDLLIRKIKTLSKHVSSFDDTHN